MSDQPTPREKVKEIAEVAAKVCSEWECEFIESLQEWEGDYTEKQLAVLDRIYRKVCDSPY